MTLETNKVIKQSNFFFFFEKQENILVPRMSTEKHKCSRRQYLRRFRYKTIHQEATLQFGQPQLENKHGTLLRLVHESFFLFQL